MNTYSIHDSELSPAPVEIAGIGNRGDELMTIREERLTILRMVEEGKISTEEGAKLLAAIGEGEQAGSQPTNNFDMSSTLRVRVTDTITGKHKVNVNLPIGLVKFGLRFVPDSANVDKAAIEQAHNTGMKGCIVDVNDEEDGTHVEVLIE